MLKMPIFKVECKNQLHIICFKFWEYYKERIRENLSLDYYFSPTGQPLIDYSNQIDLLSLIVSNN